MPERVVSITRSLSEKLDRYPNLRTHVRILAQQASDKQTKEQKRERIHLVLVEIERLVDEARRPKAA